MRLLALKSGASINGYLPMSSLRREERKMEFLLSFLPHASCPGSIELEVVDHLLMVTFFMDYFFRQMVNFDGARRNIEYVFYGILFPDEMHQYKNKANLSKYLRNLSLKLENDRSIVLISNVKNSYFAIGLKLPLPFLMTF